DFQGLRVLLRRANRRHPQRRNRTKINACRWHYKVLVLMQVILQMKRLARIFDGIELNVIDISRQAPTRGKGFHEVLPLRLRKSAKAGAQRPIAISLSGDVEGRVERAELAELAVEGEVHEGLDGRIRRRPLQAALAVIRRQHG